MDPAEAVYEVVRRVPSGRVVTYGQVADLVESVHVSAREVGGIMSVCPENVPWQRVVGAGGRLPIGKRSPDLRRQQRRLLEGEGVRFLSNDCVDMAAFQWREDGEEPQGSLF